MVSLATAYWMGLAAADSARASQDMWEIASRVTRRHVAAPDLDWEPLIEKINHLQAQLQQARAERETLRAQCNANYHAWAMERDLRQKAETALESVKGELDENHPLNWGNSP